MPSPYSTIWVADGSSKGAQNILLTTAQSFIIENSINGDKTSNELDQLFFTKLFRDESSLQPFLCLRCRVSHCIYFTVNDIFEKYKNFCADCLKADLSDEFLNDGGESFLRIPRKSDSKAKRRFIRRPIDFLFYKKMNKEDIPFGVDVIQSFEPSFGVKLSTWATRKVQWSAGLKKFLRQYGFRNISPFALLANTSSKRVKEACEKYGYKDETLIDLQKLHA